MRLKSFLFLMLISFFGVSCDGQDENYEIWTLVNRMGVPMVLDGTQSGVLKANEIRTMSEHFPKKSDGTTYGLRAFQFIPGEGNESYLEDGKRISGRRGQFLFCDSFTWQELNAMKLVIVIDRNMVDGKKVGAPRPDYCP